jgi:hypothetical protein
LYRIPALRGHAKAKHQFNANKILEIKLLGCGDGNRHWPYDRFVVGKFLLLRVFMVRPRPTHHLNGVSHALHCVYNEGRDARKPDYRYDLLVIFDPAGLASPKAPPFETGLGASLKLLCVRVFILRISSLSPRSLWAHDIVGAHDHGDQTRVNRRDFREV